MLSYQQHQLAEQALNLAISLNASHFYVDTSVPGNSIENWLSARIYALQRESRRSSADTYFAWGWSSHYWTSFTICKGWCRVALSVYKR